MACFAGHPDQFCHDAEDTNAYMYAMSSLLGFFFVFAFIATVVVLVVGVVSFAINGSFYKKNSNHLMRLRVLFQGLAVLFLGVSVWLFAS